MQNFQLDKLDSSKLDSRWATHKIKFKEKLEESIFQYNLYDIMNQYCIMEASFDQLELIDEIISIILNKVRKAAEGLRRGVPFSISKLKEYSRLMYWTV